MPNKSRMPARIESRRNWWQIRLTTLLLVTTILVVALCWWKDRQEYAVDKAKLESALTEQFIRETSLERQLTHAENIRELVGLLDPNQVDHQAAIRLLLGLGAANLEDSPFLSGMSFKRVQLPANAENLMEIVVGHISVHSIPGWEDTVVLLLERITEVAGDGPPFQELRVVDCLVRHTQHRLLSGEHHRVSLKDGKGDQITEVIFEFRSQENTDKWTEVFQPTPNGFARIESAVPVRLTQQP